jgi:hypothetical protein
VPFRLPLPLRYHDYFAGQPRGSVRNQAYRIKLLLQKAILPEMLDANPDFHLRRGGTDP